RAREDDVPGRAAVSELPRREARAVRVPARGGIGRDLPLVPRVARLEQSEHAPVGAGRPALSLLPLADAAAQDLRLAAAVLPRHPEPALPELHDMPYGRSRLERVAAAPEVGAAMRHAARRLLCLALLVPAVGASSLFAQGIPVDVELGYRF